MLFLRAESWLASVKHKHVKALGTVVEIERGGILRNVKTLLFAVAAIVLVGGVVLIETPRQGDAAQSKVLTGRDLLAAYERINPGLTRASQLGRFGLDTSAHAQVLSYLGVMERFMPHDSVAFDRLDPGVRDCIAARDRCMALVFRAADPARAATDHGLFSTFGLGAAAAANTPQVTLLIRNGRVGFKMISGVATLPGVRSTAMQTSAPAMRAVPIAVRLDE
jgi:hypothetical protein